MNVETAVENLGEIKDILDKIGVEFWLDLGTLLGAVRDGKVQVPAGTGPKGHYLKRFQEKERQEKR